ncbi:hypothetical protein [Actibacterium ureilyticum]|uniref:hypothetical protein n=1 Tax=Actibacterium ureilyticum TaxID=1590614 RepID=UPI000BAAE4C0|nr:hypothetical protein [Actibacterium ureilyticum]
MLKFLFGGRKPAEAKPETQREAFARLVGDLNEAIVALPEKPKFVIDPETGGFELVLPEQLPDEALALPAPEVEVPELEESVEEVAEEAAEKDTAAA